MTRRAWVVRSTDPTFAVVRDAGVVAVNFFVRFDATRLDEAQLRARLRDTDSKWYVRQLFNFVHGVGVGDTVFTKDGRFWFAGTVTGEYRYDPERIPDHPHLREVDWESSPLDDAESARIQAAITNPQRTVIPFDLDSTAHRVAPLQAHAPRVSDPEPEPQAPSIERRTSAEPTWPSIEDGPLEPCGRTARPCRPPAHSRFRHVATLRNDPSVDGPAVLVVGLNPSCPDDPSQPTFQAVTKLGDVLNARWVGMVNLLARRAPDLSAIASEDNAEIVGNARSAVTAILPQVDVVIGAWGTAPGASAGKRVADLAEVERRWIEDQAARARVPVLGIDGRPLHPSRWLQWIRTRSPERGNEMQRLANRLAPLR